MVNLNTLISRPVTIGKRQFPNPIFLASGTAGFGEELSPLLPLHHCGGIVIKGTSINPRQGNAPSRLVETPSGLLNAIGLQNPGVDAVIANKLPLLDQIGVPVVVNVVGYTQEEYVSVVQKMVDCQTVAAFEINISCPNVKSGLDHGTDPTWIEAVIRKVKKVSNDIPVIAKLTPNCTDITALAKAAENGGADGLSLINTVLGMAFDIRSQTPVLANGVGGLSGPAIRPIAIRMVYQVRQKTQLPIMGIGGITCIDDVFEFFLAGATAVQLGTITFMDLNAVKTIIAAANPQ